jgi:hypothetical protein
VQSLRPGAPGLVRQREGDRLRPVLGAIQPDGGIKRRDAGPRDGTFTLRHPQKLGLKVQRVPSGPYRVGFVTRDPVGRWAGASQPVDVRR